MYLPPHFAETDLDTLHRHIDDHPLATIVTMGADGIDANHIPFLVERQRGRFGTLIAHVARGNDLWRDALAATGRPGTPESLVIFQGPDAYVSPNWYATKRDTHKVVPTYNYLVVHAYGVVQVHDDPKWVRGMIGKLTKRMEAGQPVPWKMADAPRDFIDDLVGQIVGIELEITRIVGKAKLNQNRSVDDRRGVVAGLRSMDRATDVAMAELVDATIEG